MISVLSGYWDGRSVCRQIYKHGLSGDIPLPPQPPRGQKGVLTYSVNEQQDVLVDVPWHKNGTRNGSTRPAWNQSSDWKALCLHTDRISCYLNYVYIIRGLWGLRAGNPPPPSQVNKAGTTLCYCRRRNLCLSRAAANNSDQFCVKHCDNGDHTVFG